MRNDDLEKIWLDVELQRKSKGNPYQSMVCVNLLYRAYVGSTGIPARRYISIEIPESDKEQFDTFTVPQGFTLTIETPIVKHDGYSSCVLQAASASQNDVFTIVVKDILNELNKQENGVDFVKTLKNRIEKWKNFFKNPSSKKLSDEMVIGLIGELTFIQELLDYGIDCGTDFWNGPVKSAQDFQGNTVAIEVKTAATNSLEYVKISSDNQLDDNGRKALFLVVYRVEHNDATGINLPKLVSNLVSRLKEQQINLFLAKLLCLGYTEETSKLYNHCYSVKEQRVYRVKDEFPRLVRHDLPQGITEINYKLSLHSCEQFIDTIESIIYTIKEYEYGEN